MKAFRSWLLASVLLSASCFAQETEQYFHGAATLRQKGGPDIHGAVTVIREDVQYLERWDWCALHWTIVFVPEIKDLSFIREVSIPPGTYSSAWVTSPDKGIQGGGWYYILSDRDAAFSLTIIPASAEIRRIFSRLDYKYAGTKIFTKGAALKGLGDDQIQIDLFNSCSSADEPIREIQPRIPARGNRSR